MGKIIDDFSKAIYSDEREIKSYVKILYDVPTIQYEFDEETGGYNYGIEVSSVKPNKHIISDLETIVSEVDYFQEDLFYDTKFASLEQDFFKLDGSLCLPVKNKSNEYAGYVSNLVTNSDKNKNFGIGISLKPELISNPISGITIFFKDNSPTYLTITFECLEKGTMEINYNNINQEEIIFIDFGEPLNITKDGFYIETTDWYRSDRRIRIKRIELGHIINYEDNDLISLNCEETCKRFCDETPEDECTIVLDNYDNKFDLLNENGLSKYLVPRKTKAIPYIGVVLESGKIQYQKMQTYYLDTWDTNDDGTATLNFKNLFSIIKEKNIEEIGEGGYNSLLQEKVDTFDLNHSLQDNFLLILGNIYGVEQFQFYRDGENMKGNWDITTKTNTSKIFIEFIQKLSIACGLVIKSTRQEGLDVIPDYKTDYKDPDLYIIDELDSNDFLEEPKITKVDKINTIKFISNIYSEKEVAEGETKYNESMIYKLNNFKAFEAIRLDLDNYGEINPATIEFYKSEASAIQLVKSSKNNEYQYNGNMLFIYPKFSSVEGENEDTTIGISYCGLDKTEISKIYSNKENIEKEITLEIKNEFIPQDNEILKKVSDYYLNNATKYKVSFDFVGNPKLKAGDYIIINTKYGKMELFIEKISFNYDGGLSSKVEGVVS